MNLGSVAMFVASVGPIDMSGNGLGVLGVPRGRYQRSPSSRDSVATRPLAGVGGERVAFGQLSMPSGVISRGAIQASAPPRSLTLPVSLCLGWVTPLPTKQ